jgi:hypothetical protein
MDIKKQTTLPFVVPGVQSEHYCPMTLFIQSLSWYDSDWKKDLFSPSNPKEVVLPAKQRRSL